MPHVPNELLQEIYASETVQDADGNSYELHSGIPPEYAEVLYRLVKEQRPELVLEVGMAYGTSSLAILTALQENGDGGRLVSVDPNQRDGYHGVGISNVARAGFEQQHELVEAPDFHALPDLHRKLGPIDFAYIDGWHTFDYVLLDFFYIDKMLRKDGIVGFNDCKWPAVQKALGYVRTHRRYARLELDFHLDKERGRLLKSLYRRYAGVPDEYYRKVEDWEPSFDFFEAF